MIDKSTFRDESIRLLQDLVRIDSTNGNEAKIAEYISKWFNTNKMKGSLQSVTDSRNNCWGWFGDWSWESRMEKSLQILFHGHIDTVPLFSMQDPLSGKIIDDRVLWGRGSVDQKGGIAAVMIAMKYAHLALGESCKYPFGFVGVVDEESEHRGSYKLVEEGIKAKYGISCEPSNLNIGVGVKGTYPLKVTTYGKSAHGSQPEKGVNAIKHMTRVIEELAKLEFQEIDLGALGKIKGTLNIGLINGGQAYNIVPNKCELVLDRRLVPGELPKTAKKQIEDILLALETNIIDFRAEIEVSRPDWNWPPIKERGLMPAQTLLDSPVIGLFEKSAESVLGYVPEKVFETGYSDLDFLINDLKIPSIEFGPGEGELCHSDQEALDLEQFYYCVQIYYDLIMRLNQS